MTQDIEAALERFSTVLVGRAARQPLITSAHLSIVLQCGEELASEVSLACLIEEPSHPLQLLLTFHTFQLLDIFDLCFDRHVHLSDTVVPPASILLIVTLVLAHVAATHLAIFLHELLPELGKKLLVDQREVLN